MASSYLPSGRIVRNAPISGRGDYAFNRSGRIQAGLSRPVFGKSPETIISHREYLCDVVGSQGFVNTAYPLNPGLPAAFPWLSTVAEQFEEYELLGCVFEYVPTSSAIGSTTNPALGSVMMATNYDPLDDDFESKQQIDSYEHAISTLPCYGAIHTVECKKRSSVLSTLFTRNSETLKAGSTLQMYDFGKFQIATQGMQGQYPVGELWVSYRIKLKKPRISPGFVGQLYYLDTPYILASPFTNSEPFLNLEDPALLPAPTFNSLTFQGNDKFKISGANTLNFPMRGVYIVTVVWSGQVAGTIVSGTVTAGSHMKFGDSTSYYYVDNTAKSMLCSFVVKVNLSANTSYFGTDVNNDITFSGGSGLAAQRIQIYVAPVAQALNTDYTSDTFA